MRVEVTPNEGYQGQSEGVEYELMLIKRTRELDLQFLDRARRVLRKERPLSTEIRNGRYVQKAEKI